MSPTTWTHLAYFLVSILLAVWVARKLFHNGRVFLVDAFRGNESLADAVNQLLLVGFYLINVGYVALALKYGARPTNLEGAIEVFATKVGWVLLVLGAMHFFNMFLLARARRSVSAERRSRDADTEPPPTLLARKPQST